jgi:hypothetical protein
VARIAPFLLSLPERALRSATALAAGLLREIGEVTIPRSVRRSRLYQNLVEATLRFLIEQVGGVQGVYPGEEALAENFLARRTAGNGLELIGILAFRASPVWVLAALAEASAGRLAATFNTPPLDVATLRQEWSAVKQDLSKIPPKNLPSMDRLRELWSEMNNEAQQHNRTVFEVSAVMALSAIGAIPEKTRWLSASTRLAVGKTGSILAGVLLDHYQQTLSEIQKTGYMHYAVRQFRPYLYGAASQFSPRRRTLTERLLSKE